MKGKSVLGKGLSALIQEAETPGRTDGKEIWNIAIADIGFNPRQPRKVFADDKLAELAASIKQVGVLQPILVRRLRPGEHYRSETVLKAAAAAGGGADTIAATPSDNLDLVTQDDQAHTRPHTPPLPPPSQTFPPTTSPESTAVSTGQSALEPGAKASSTTGTDDTINLKTDALTVTYCVVAGERRVRAATLAGETEVPAIICSYEETEALKVALLENIQREDLGPIEEAQAFGDLMEDYGATQEELASMLGKNRSTVANSLRLLSLESEIQDMLIAGELTRGHAKALLGLPAGPARLRLALLCRSRGLAVREVERRVQAASRPQRRRRRRKAVGGEETPEIKALRERAEQLFGSPVGIERDPVSGTGQISIKFFSDNDLERLLTMLGVDTDLS